MKKIFLILILFASLSGTAHAATAGQLSYTPLEPLSVWDAKADAYNNFAYYVNTVFKLLITLGSLFAIVMLVVAGIGYMVSEAAVDIEKAKQRARAALWGLLLLTGCWLILYTINPNLLNFNLNIPGSTSSPAAPSAASPAPTSITSSATISEFAGQCENQSTATKTCRAVTDPNGPAGMNCSCQ